jgi:phage replication-related protein YjqB (UPF0714/DUF867 family)
VSTFQAAVRRAHAAQQNLIDQKEHCSADPERLKAIGRARGQQVRIVRIGEESALYTVSETRQESPHAIVRMGADGRRRVGTTGEFSATVDSHAPYPTYLTDAEAKRRNEFIERVKDDGTHGGLVAIAPHGGRIEPYTDLQAEHVHHLLADKGVSSWRCKGWDDAGNAHERWHITSVDLHPASFPRLNRIMARGFTYAVAFHGLSGSGILVGGAASQSLKRAVHQALQQTLNGTGIGVRIAGAGDGLGGASRRNVVNRLTKSGTRGIHIEQSQAAREQHWKAIAAAVASVYRTRI